ncbi:hypothetical protein AGABI1DRAFT_59093 [Agaricus bisporus var. burnettii JB137-S8]|uniref:NAD(P)-binding protein n=1 Tax=Agaricus bisporus var. burnettii (strain JB137-S8 / ATCC MYA-4627 / FGSC 10392) TaxID=597362 RepID=K5X8V6_AGABU|nr:uncharacterized protein AGABI1DRAFT_59093 [Agaricus bisporus var. burnettii JB137-S8]EKM79457.1 hypothetical protein AGABI1DRAFT_59093 [Agaricus bisporus var. burnettii JB137-S8]
MGFLADLCAIDFVSSFTQTFFLPRATWTAEDMPDLSGKVAIVTGGNSGIGKEVAKALLAHNAKVYIGCRSKERAERAILDLKEATGKEAIFLPLDLASLGSVKDAAMQFANKEKELHLLINNAGVMFPPHSQLSEGYDTQFHTNVTGHWYLTTLLLPVLLETVKHSPPKSVRVVHVSSVGHYGAKAQPLNFASFKDGVVRNRYFTHELYMQSKFGNIVVANEFHRRYAGQGLVSISVNPGSINTELYRHFRVPLLPSLVLYPPKTGAITPLYAATAKDAGQYGGKYLFPWARTGKARPDTDDPKLGKDLWTWLEEQVKDT